MAKYQRIVIRRGPISVMKWGKKTRRKVETSKQKKEKLAKINNRIRHKETSLDLSEERVEIAGKKVRQMDELQSLFNACIS